MTKNLFMPSLFTLLNFFFGFLSIIKTLEGNLDAAAWFIIIAVLCDGMDGKLARLASSETPFGIELDSLADVVSSGLAAALLAYRAGLDRMGFAGVVLAFLFLFAGGYRLARFNVVQGGDRSQGYTGLPIPVAGLTVASFFVFELPTGVIANPAGWSVLLVSLTLLMISTIHYDWPRVRFDSGFGKTVQSIGVLGAVIVMAVFPRWSLLPFFVLYIVSSLGRWLTALLRGDVAITSFFLLPKGNE